MKTLVIIGTSLSLAALLVAGAAQAQGGPWAYQPSPYVGADALYWELDRNGRSDDHNGFGLRLRGGVELNDYLAIEDHLGTGGSDGPANLDYLAGGYAKGMLPITSRFKLYGLLGATEVEVDGDDDAETGFSYGGGASYAVMPTLSVDADYVNYLDE